MQRSTFSEVLCEQLAQLQSRLIREHEEETQLRIDKQELELEQLRLRVQQLEGHVEKAQLSLDMVKSPAPRRFTDLIVAKASSEESTPAQPPFSTVHRYAPDPDTAIVSYELQRDDDAQSGHPFSVMPIAPAPLPEVLSPLTAPPCMCPAASGGNADEYADLFAVNGSDSKSVDGRWSTVRVTPPEGTQSARSSGARSSSGRVTSEMGSKRSSKNKRASFRKNLLTIEVMPDNYPNAKQDHTGADLRSKTPDTDNGSESSGSEVLGSMAPRMSRVLSEPAVRQSVRDAAAAAEYASRAASQVSASSSAPKKSSGATLSPRATNQLDIQKKSSMTSEEERRASTLAPLELFSERINQEPPLMGSTFSTSACSNQRGEPTMAALGMLKRGFSSPNVQSTGGKSKRTRKVKRTSNKGSIRNSKGSHKPGRVMPFSLKRAFSGEAKEARTKTATGTFTGVFHSMGVAVTDAMSSLNFGKAHGNRRHSGKQRGSDSETFSGEERTLESGALPGRLLTDTHRHGKEWAPAKSQQSSHSLSSGGLPVPASQISGEFGPKGETGLQGSPSLNSNQFESLEIHPIWKVDRRATNQRGHSIFHRAHTQMLKKVHAILVDETIEEQVSCYRKLALNPHAAGRIQWDLIGFLLIIYDVVMVPMLFFDFQKLTAMDVVEWFSRIYWSVDIILNFCTGYVGDEGEVVKVFKLVAYRYARSWLILDIAVVLLVWMEVTTDGLRHASVIKGLRGSRGTLRILRAVRLLRLLRMETKSQYLLRSLSFLVRSEGLMIVLGIVKIMCILGVLMHIIACFWYAVGVMGVEDSNTGWLVTNELQTASLGYKYVTSFHWSLAQFTGSDSVEPQSHIERTFAVMTLFPAFVISASVVSSITTSMTQLQILSAHSSRQLTQLHRYLQDHGISAHLATRVQRNAQHFIHEQKRNTPETSVELLKVLSQPLRVELAYEVHGPVLQWHPFFRLYNRMSPAGLRQVCHAAVQRLFLAKDDVLFHDGEMPAQPRMFFLLTGELQYKRRGKSIEFVEAGEWISEPVLWTLSWVHHGSMSASTECNLLCLIAEAFQQITKQFMTGPQFQPGLYANLYVQSLKAVSEDERKEVYCEEYADVSEMASKVGIEF